MILATGVASVYAAPAPPIHVAIECAAGEPRTKACPTLLLGLVDATPALLAAPRSDADVVVYATATPVALVDHLHLRFVGTLAGAPPLVEVDVDLDTRADDDAQRAALEPAFLRGIALFVAARYPKSVAITLSEPEAADRAVPDTSPYDLRLVLTGFGNYTKQFQQYTGIASLSAGRLDARSRVELQVFGNAGINKQPPLPDGAGGLISLDTTQWQIGVGSTGAYLLSKTWSVGATGRLWKDDPDGQLRYGAYIKGGLEWDAFPANDPRGNRLAVAYLLGAQAEAYNVADVLGESDARYPIHSLMVSGAVRKDRFSFGLSLVAEAQLLDPERRFRVSATPFIELKLGGHVDLSLSFSVTRRELPGPNRDLVDPMDYARLSRLAFAEPLAVNGTLSLSLHLDPTNGARNDRFSDL